MLERQSIAADAGFWPAAARAVVDFAACCGCPPDRLNTLDWVVGNAAHATLARAGLRTALGGAAFIPPRISTLAKWLGAPLPDRLGDPLAASIVARAELFTALRGNAWVRASFGDQPAALWALARGIAQLSDELTWAAAGDEHAFAGRLEASLARHFQRRAARALEPQARLVLQLWRARRADDPAVRALRELDARAHAASTPLVYTAASEAQRWELAFLQRYAQCAPVLFVCADSAASVRARPVLAAAWPELAGAAPRMPLAERAARVDAAATPLTVVRADSLEEEATAIARCVLDWLAEGVESIALVALDRLTARRARALLERAQVNVRDETGWKLATTSAAAAVMRWFDLVADDLYWRDLLDWMKSPFTLCGQADKAHATALIERAIRASGTVQGARAIRRAVAAQAAREDADPSCAQRLLDLIDTQAQCAPRAAPLAAHARALGTALDALGLRSGLAADPVGREVLRELDALADELAPIAGRATLADFRALLAERFEEVSYVDRQVDSPVAMVSIAGAHLRRFDAALLIGADARHLPGVPEEALFMSNAVRAELGLATFEAGQRRQAEQLVTLLASAPRVAATWRTRHADEPNPISPLLERLQFVAAHALGDDLARTVSADEFAIEAVPLARPAPAAPALLPRTLTASSVQSLVTCAYQFYARRLLRLAELDEVIEAADKRDFGEALHEVLRRFHEEWGAADFGALDAVAVAESLRMHGRAVFEPWLERTPSLLAFERRFDRLVDGYIEWLKDSAAEGWRWQAAEHTISRPLVLDGGGAVELTGRIDRIDAHADGRVRVLDYKARAREVLARALKEAGEDVQLPFYGLLLARPADAVYVSFDRATDGEPGVHAVVPPQPFGELVERVGKRLRTDIQRIASGAPLPALGIDAACALCEMRGLCRVDYWRRGDASN